MGGDRRRSPEGDRGLRPFSLPSGSCSFYQHDKEINFGSLKKQTIFHCRKISPLRRRQGGFPIAPLTPSVHTTVVGFYRCKENCILNIAAKTIIEIARGFFPLTSPSPSPSA